MKRYMTRKGDMLDEIVFRYYGQTSGFVEKVLDHNRHLAEKGDILEADIEIILPDLLSQIEHKEISLWD